MSYRITLEFDSSSSLSEDDVDDLVVKMRRALESRFTAEKICPDAWTPLWLNLSVDKIEYADQLDNNAPIA